MDKIYIGLLFILAGISYGSLSIDDIYKHTVGYLIEHDWVKPPVADKNKNSLPNLLGAKQTILLYAGVLIIIGLFIIWNRNN
jgi:hypothetical protein